MKQQISKHPFAPKAGNSFICAISMCREPEGAEIHQNIPKYVPAEHQNGSNGSAGKSEKHAPITKAASRRYVSMKFGNQDLYDELAAAAEEEGISPSTLVLKIVAGHFGYKYQPAQYVKMK